MHILCAIQFILYNKHHHFHFNSWFSAEPGLASSPQFLLHAVNCVGFCFWHCDFVLFVYKISREPLNGFAPNSHGRHIWSLAHTNLNVKVKGQGTMEKNGIFRTLRRPACCLCFVKHLKPLVLLPLVPQENLQSSVAHVDGCLSCYPTVV